MTIKSLISDVDTYQNYVIGYFIVLFLVALFTVLIVNQKNMGIIKYAMTTVVYGVTIPGMLAIYLLLYHILFLNTNILNINIVSYFVPILSLLIILVLLGRKVKMSELPGFARLSSLFVMISIAFGIIFVLHRSRFGVLIFSGFMPVLIAFFILMIIMRIAWNRFTN